MPLYTFHLFARGGQPTTFDAIELPDDAASFTHAGTLLEQHPSCDHIDVWEWHRDLGARYRQPPIIRSVQVPALVSA